MGKKESVLIPFLIEALKAKKYGFALTYVDENNEVFRMVLPHKARKIDECSITLLKDWDVLKNHTGVFNYTESNRRMKAALRRSAYLKHWKNNQYPLTYQILSHDNVKHKKDIKRSCPSDYAALSPTESGYSSSFESELSVTHLMDNEREQFTDEPSSNAIFQADVKHLNILNNSFIVNHDSNFSYFSDENLENLTDDGLKDLIDINGDISSDCDTNWLFQLIDKQCESDSNRLDIVYRFKFENLLREEILMVCEPKELTSEEQVFEVCGLAVDINVYRRIQNYNMIHYFCRDDHLFLFLKLQKNSFLNL